MTSRALLSSRLTSGPISFGDAPTGRDCTHVECCAQRSVRAHPFIYARGDAGINDFDVYTFYAQHPRRPWYAKSRSVRDFGDAKFGQSVDKPDFVGRRVDLMGRGILADPREDPVTAVQRYLRSDRPGTVRLLAGKAIVLIDPKPLRGRLIWVAGTAVS